MKFPSPPASIARKLLTAGILPFCLVLTVLAHAADHSLSGHRNPLLAAPLVLAQQGGGGGGAVPFQPAHGLGLSIICFGLGLVHLSRLRRRLRRVSVTA